MTCQQTNAIDDLIWLHVQVWFTLCRQKRGGKVIGKILIAFCHLVQRRPSKCKQPSEWPELDPISHLPSPTNLQCLRCIPSPDPTQISAFQEIVQDWKGCFWNMLFSGFSSWALRWVFELWWDWCEVVCFPRLPALDITPRKSQTRGQQRTSSLHRIPRLHWLREKTEQLLFASTDC